MSSVSAFEFEVEERARRDVGRRASSVADEDGLEHVFGRASSPTGVAVERREEEADFGGGALASDEGERFSLAGLRLDMGPAAYGAAAMRPK